MVSLWLLTKKNLKLLLRSKGSALIVVFAPLLIILILGLSFNTSASFDLTIGVHAASFGEDANKLMTSLQEDGFRVVKYETSIAECVEDVKLGFVHSCISLPDTFAIEGDTPKEVTFHIDQSRLNLVWMVQQNLREKFDLQSQQISEVLTGNILSKLSETRTKVDAEKDKLGEVKQTNTNAASSTTAAREALANVDLSLSQEARDQSALNNFKSGMEGKLKTGKDKIDDAFKAIDDTSLNQSDKDSIKALLDEASDHVTNASALLNNNDAASLKGVSNLINLLNSDLSESKTKLSTATEAVTNSITSLQGVGDNLNGDVSKLEAVQAALNEISASLNEQSVADAGTITKPLVTKIETISEPKTNLNYLFPILLMVVIMFSSLLLGTTLVMMEKNSPAFMRNFFLPVRKVTFIISTYLTNLVLLIIQVGVILGISLFFIQESHTVMPQVALVLFIAGTVFTFLGMAIGYIFTSEETGVLASVSAGSILLFLSGVILPLEGMSPVVRQVTAFNPFVLGEKLIRELFLFGSQLQAVWVDLLILGGYAFVLFLVILIIESVLHQHLVNKFMRHKHRAHRQKQKEKKPKV